MLKKITAVLALALALAMFGCKKNELDLTDNTIPASNGPLVEVFPKAEEIQTFTIITVDAKTGLPIGVSDGKSVRLLFEGKNKGSIRIAGGSNVAEVNTDYGIASIASSVFGTELDLFDLRVIASAVGYVPTSKSIISSDSSSQIITISMVKIDDTPTGVSSKVDNSIAISGGVTKTEVKITSPTVITSNTKATVTIPTGVEMKDKNGNILTGAIKSTMVYFNAKDDAAILATPEGPVTANGVTENRDLHSLGMVSLEMADVSGTKVKTFNKPIAITTEIPDNTINPFTGNTVNVGEILDVYSYDTETGIWKYEDTTTVKLVGGKLQATMYATHLSTWSVNFRYDYKVSGCNGSWTYLTVKVDDKLYKDAPLDLSFYSKKTGLLVRKVNTLTQFEGLTHITADGKVIDPVLIVKSSAPSKNCSGKFIGEVEINLCDGKFLPFNLKTNLNYVAPVKVTGTITGTCKAKPNVKVKPTAPVVYFKISGGQDCVDKFGFTQMTEGKISAEVELGATYLAWFMSGGKAFGKLVTIDANNPHFEINADFSDLSDCK